jgi:hypothetical protein
MATMSPVASAAGMKASGVRQAPFGVLPAHEALDAADRARRDVDLGLVDHAQLVVGRGAP